MARDLLIAANAERSDGEASCDDGQGVEAGVNQIAKRHHVMPRERRTGLKRENTATAHCNREGTEGEEKR